jgi:malonyl-CoA O-methyltransferase
MRAAYEVHRHEGRLPATYEVVYGHAWAPLQRVKADGSVTLPMSAIGRAVPGGKDVESLELQ